MNFYPHLKRNYLKYVEDVITLTNNTEYILLIYWKSLIFTAFFVLWKISFEIEFFVVMIIIIINQTKRMPHLWNWLIFSHFNQSDLVILLKTMRGSQDSTCIQSIRMYNILVISVKTCCIMSECDVIIIIIIMKFLPWPLRANSSLNFAENVFCLPRWLLCLTRASNNV